MNVDHLMNRKLECLKTYNLDVKINQYLVIYLIIL